MSAPLYPSLCDLCPTPLTTENTAVLGDGIFCIHCAWDRAESLLASTSASEAEREDAREICGWQGARQATR